MNCQWTGVKTSRGEICHILQNFGYFRIFCLKANILDQQLQFDIRCKIETVVLRLRSSFYYSSVVSVTKSEFS